MKKYDIQNIDDLKAKRNELKRLSEVQYLQLKNDVSSFAHKFTVKGFLGGHINRNTITAFDNKTGITKKISSVMLPMLLNKTLFRKSGFLSKLLVSITGSKLGANLDLENILAVVSVTKDYIMEYFSNSKKTGQKENFSREIPTYLNRTEEEVLGI